MVLNPGSSSHTRHDSHHADQCALHGPVWRRASHGHRQRTDSRLDYGPYQLSDPRRHHLWRRLYRQRRERACRGRLSLTVTALGTINANGGHAMVLQTGAHAIHNGGLIETTSTGGLTIDSQMFQNGQLVAAGTGALTINGVLVQGLGNVRTSKTGRIVLHRGQLTIGGLVNIGSAAAPGGTLTTTSGDTLGLLASSNDSFAGADVLSADINNYGTIAVADGSTLNLHAAVINSSTGTLALNGSTGPTKLELYDTGATVSGGLILLSNSAQNSIVSDGAATQFSNASTLRGSGTIGDGGLRL